MPHLQHRPDETIKAEVQEQLHRDWRVDADEVTVKVDQAEVTLAGTLPSYTAHAAAIEDAWRVRGINDVHVHLEIRNTFGHPSPWPKRGRSTRRTRSRARQVETFRRSGFAGGNPTIDA